MRAFLSRAVDNMNLPSVVEGLPILIHLAVFLFFAGLIVFLLNVNDNVCFPVNVWIGLFSILYAFITFMPMFRPDSPYYSPLSAPVAFISGLLLLTISGTATIFLLSLSLLAALIRVILRSCFIPIWITIYSWTRPSGYHRLRDWYGHWNWYDWAHDRLWHIIISINDAAVYCDDRITNLEKAVEEITHNRSSEIDPGILDWTISTLGDDDTLENFFHVIPDFFNSQMVNGIKKPLRHVSFEVYGYGYPRNRMTV